MEVTRSTLSALESLALTVRFWLGATFCNASNGEAVTSRETGCPGDSILKGEGGVTMPWYFCVVCDIRCTPMTPEGPMSNIMEAERTYDSISLDQVGYGRGCNGRVL